MQSALGLDYKICKLKGNQKGGGAFVPNPSQFYSSQAHSAISLSMERIMPLVQTLHSFSDFLDSLLHTLHLTLCSGANKGFKLARNAHASQFAGRPPVVSGRHFEFSVLLSSCLIRIGLIKRFVICILKP